MPDVKGRVGEKTVDVLRDTGCSGVVVKKTLSATISKGQVEAQCLSDPIYDLIIGNVPDSRDAQNLNPSWQEA